MYNNISKFVHGAAVDLTEICSDMGLRIQNTTPVWPVTPLNISGKECTGTTNSVIYSYDGINTPRVWNILARAQMILTLEL